MRYRPPKQRKSCHDKVGLAHLRCRNASDGAVVAPSRASASARGIAFLASASVDRRRKALLFTKLTVTKTPTLWMGLAADWRQAFWVRIVLNAKALFMKCH